MAQALVVAMVAARLASRGTSRLAPLHLLFNMTLVFPDHAPSRFRLALRSGTVKRLLTSDELRLSGDRQVAAEQAIELVTRLRLHDPLTRGHTERGRAYAEMIGRQMNLSGHEVNSLRWGVLLHDVGRLAVPREILNKPGKPDAEEWAILKTHPAVGGEIVAPLAPWLGDGVLAASQHHERWDGAGYPAGLVGEDISLAGRIAAVADAYDVITSRRSYKAPLSAETARKELVDGAGTQFDPGVVRAMLQCGLEQPRSLELIGRLLELPGVARAASPGIAVPVAAAIANVAGLTVAPTHADSVPVTVAADVSSVAEAPPRSGTVPSTTANCDRVRGGDHEMAGADLSGCDLSGLTIDGIDLSDADLRDADLSDMAVTNFNLNGVNPRGADLRNAAFVDTPFGFAQVLRTNLSNGSFSGVNFNDADISESTFRDATRRRRRACGGAREPLVGRLFSRQFANPTASNTLPLGSSQSRRRWRGDGYAIADGLGLDGCSGSIRTGA